MKRISTVYDHNKKTKKITPNERLTHHQKHSAPLMDQIKEYIAKLIDEHIIEPNSSLGKAIQYMQRNWFELTQVLLVPNAPLDNNILEQALKIPIHR